jgi:CheY-like chemotaxis protein
MVGMNYTRDVTRGRLEALGMRVRVATDGFEALAQVQQGNAGRRPLHGRRASSGTAHPS